MELNTETKTEVKIAIIENRLDQIEDVVTEIKELSINMTKMITEVSHLTSSIQSLNVRVSALEATPKDIIKSIVGALISAFIGGAIGHFIF